MADDSAPDLPADQPAAASESAPTPPPTPPPVPPQAPENTFHSLSFTGAGSEYFKIWIVNLALTVVTFGIYSAWAKVRRLQYFYRHTRLAGTGFDYHGNPIAILKGRIIGLILFGLYSSVTYVDWRVAVAILAGLAVSIPWLLSQSFRFRLHNTSFRGIRFKFHGKTRDAYWIFLAWPVFTFMSIFTLGPLWHHRLKRYQFSNAAFGTTRFSIKTGAGEFYITYILAAFLWICLMVAVFFVFIFIGVFAALGRGPTDAPPELSPAFFVLLVLGGAAYALAFLTVHSVVTSRIHNACWNETSTPHHRFESRLSAWRLLGIQYTNFLATVFTVGLFRPFAQVRLARYLTETLTAFGTAGFDVYTATDGEDVAAIGEETAEFFDLDVAF